MSKGKQESSRVGDGVKAVQVTLPKIVAERLSLLRKAGKAGAEFNKLRAAVIEGQVAACEQRFNIPKDAWKSAKTCPACSSGVLIEKRPNDKTRPPFIGCSRYPDCRHTENYSK